MRSTGWSRGVKTSSAPGKMGGTEAAKRRMRRDVVLQAEEVDHLVVGIPTINAGTVLRDVAKRG